MTGVLNLFMGLNCVLILGLSELYYSAYYITKNARLSKKTLLLLKNSKVIFLNSTFKGIFYLLIQSIGLLTFKITRYNYESLYIKSSIYMYMFLLVFIILNSLFFLYKVKNSQVVTLVLIKLVLIINFLFITNNLITLLLVIELLATIYYFFFLNSIETKKNSLIKIKNLLVNYIWLSLLTLLFFIVAVIFIILNAGTLDFLEINLLSRYISSVSYSLLFIAIAWKLGLPMFHFFKVELYQFLDLNIIFYFSIFSIIVNVYIFIFIGLNIPGLYISINTLIIACIILSNIVILYRGLDLINFFQFLAFSGLNTISTIIIFLVI